MGEPLGKHLSWNLKTFHKKSTVDCHGLLPKWEWKTSVIMITSFSWYMLPIWSEDVNFK